MASELVNDHCSVVYEQNSIVNSIRTDNWTAERAIIGSNFDSNFADIV